MDNRENMFDRSVWDFWWHLPWYSKLWIGKIMNVKLYFQNGSKWQQQWSLKFILYIKPFALTITNLKLSQLIKFYHLIFKLTKFVHKINYLPIIPIKGQLMLFYYTKLSTVENMHLQNLLNKMPFYWIICSHIKSKINIPWNIPWNLKLVEWKAILSP